jgi:hypothetical protein
VSCDQTAAQLVPITDLSECFDCLTNDQALRKPNAVFGSRLSSNQEKPSHLVGRKLDRESRLSYYGVCISDRASSIVHHPHLLSAKVLCYNLANALKVCLVSIG